jgi:hypothetical protein
MTQFKKEQSMSQFILFLQETPGSFSQYSPEEMGAIVGKYIAWTNSLQERDLLVSSNKLKDEGGRWLKHENGALSVVDGPYTEAAEVIGGYYVVKATDYDEAVALANECPHLSYGGRIEVREVDLMMEEPA